jgi:hypothetical protein
MSNQEWVRPEEEQAHVLLALYMSFFNHFQEKKYTEESLGFSRNDQLKFCHMLWSDVHFPNFEGMFAELVREVGFALFEQGCEWMAFVDFGCLNKTNLNEWLAGIIAEHGEWLDIKPALWRHRCMTEVTTKGLEAAQSSGSIGIASFYERPARIWA